MVRRIHHPCLFSMILIAVAATVERAQGPIKVEIVRDGLTPR
ncbi:MAG: hypothetical protein ACT4PL_14615 [Phycisphaerales bacterium]